MSDKERPYHIQAIYDLQADHSPDSFRFAVGECRKVIAQVIAEDNTSAQQIARVKILRYLDLQLSRAVRWIDEEADLLPALAIVLRSQIELRFWAEHVSAGTAEAEAEAFLNEANIDAKELVEKMAKAFPTAPLQPLPAVAGKRITPQRRVTMKRNTITSCARD